MLASLTFVVIGLIQFSLVLHLHQINAKHAKDEQPREEELNLNKEVLIKEHVEVQFQNRNVNFNIKKIDNAAFYITGSLFIMFNAIYWLTFTVF